MNKASKFDTRKIVLLALLTAIVIVLQYLAILTRPLFPTFAITLVLVPIVIGAALVSPLAGGWLGFVFGVVVLVSGDATSFMAVDPLGTVIVVVVKGIVAGLLAGIVYRLVAKTNKTIGAIAAAIICPIGNTGVFVIGSYIFFIPTLTEWAAAAGFENVTTFIFLGMIGLNFIVEMVINLLLSPTIVRLVQYGQDRRKIST